MGMDGLFMLTASSGGQRGQQPGLRLVNAAVRRGGVQRDVELRGGPVQVYGPVNE